MKKIKLWQLIAVILIILIGVATLIYFLNKLKFLKKSNNLQINQLQAELYSKIEEISELEKENEELSNTINNNPEFSNLELLNKIHGSLNEYYWLNYENAKDFKNILEEYNFKESIIYSPYELLFNLDLMSENQIKTNEHKGQYFNTAIDYQLFKDKALEYFCISTEVFDDYFSDVYINENNSLVIYDYMYADAGTATSVILNMELISHSNNTYTFNITYLHLFDPSDIDKCDDQVSTTNVTFSLKNGKYIISNIENLEESLQEENL